MKIHPALRVPSETWLDPQCWHKAHMAEQTATRWIIIHIITSQWAFVPSSWWDAGSLFLIKRLPEFQRATKCFSTHAKGCFISSSSVGGDVHQASMSRSTEMCEHTWPVSDYQKWRKQVYFRTNTHMHINTLSPSCYYSPALTSSPFISSSPPPVTSLVQLLGTTSPPRVWDQSSGKWLLPREPTLESHHPLKGHDGLWQPQC